MMSYEKIKKLEIDLSKNSLRKDHVWLSELIEDNFEEIGASGRVFSKKDILQELATEKVIEFKLSNFRFTELSEGCILVKYVSNNNNNYAHRCSIWIKSADKWRIIFHQGTPFQETAQQALIV